MLAGEEWDGDTESHFVIGSRAPDIKPGERVYIVCEDKLRGYAPLVRLDSGFVVGRISLVRHNDAVAVTLPYQIRGFQGFRYRWWEREEEIPFPNWMEA